MTKSGEVDTETVVFFVMSGGRVVLVVVVDVVVVGVMRLPSLSPNTTNFLLYSHSSETIKKLTH